MAKGRKKTGRPSRYSDALAESICERIAEGESLVSICRSDAMPGYSTVLRWLDANEEFRGRYARARDDQAERFAQEIVDIADTEEDTQRAKLRMDARKWVAAKLLPKKYGERQTLEHEGAGGGPIIISLLGDDDDDD
jgi:hypothetical protein